MGQPEDVIAGDREVILPVVWPTVHVSPVLQVKESTGLCFPYSSWTWVRLYRQWTEHLGTVV